MRDGNTEVPKGDPDFVSLGQYWIIDEAGKLSGETIEEGDKVLQKLKEDGIAEVVILVQTGISHPEDYATHYGRWLGLGEKGPASEGGNNGLVWLIRPDAELKMTVSVGRGLPKFTSSDYGEIMDAAKDYINFSNYDKGVQIIVSETDKYLRNLYGKDSDQ
jgi:uncharacterized membrane protein YgcG